MALRNIEWVFSIAELNKYGVAEMAIFKILKEMAKEEKIIGFIDELALVINKQGKAVINLDKDAVVYWVGAKGY